MSYIVHNIIARVHIADTFLPRISEARIAVHHRWPAGTGRED
jgi:hypothetical protein